MEIETTEPPEEDMVRKTMLIAFLGASLVLWGAVFGPVRSRTGVIRGERLRQ
ncbi:MAG: hypothetical protein KJ621_07210 [Proteobacteria bacterium]|nr:hypothetical protein [Pseudomonadota bacterium]